VALERLKTYLEDERQALFFPTFRDNPEFKETLAEIGERKVTVAKTIQQTVRFMNVSPEQLFDVFMDPEKHTRLTGAKVSVNQEVGSDFTAFNGVVTGKNLLIVPGRMIVQSWRGNVWSEADLDSIQILTFDEIPGGGQITLIHANCPDQLIERWNELYWEPLRSLAEVL
jgi:activator of HSP90 ATPase